MKRRKIVITGGHLTPALAVIEELQKRGNWEIFYIGRKYTAEGDKKPSLESIVIQEKGLRFIPINFGRLQHKFTRYTLPAFLRIPWGFIFSFYHLARIKPDIILSFGSYVGVPVVISGWLLRIPAVIHEQTTVVGLGNKISSFFAKKICISWPETLDKFPKDKVVLNGNPLRSDIFKKENLSKFKLEFTEKKPLILITGGNQGSHRINVAVEGILEKLLSDYNLFHQVGHLAFFGDFERLSEKKKKLPTKLKNSYHLEKYVGGQRWISLLHKADLVVSRAGINTITELLALGKPQLLIPIPWLPGDEQTKNAWMVKKNGLGEILFQEELTPKKLYQKIKMMMSQIDVYRKKVTQKKNLIMKNAAEKIINELEKII